MNTGPVRRALAAHNGGPGLTEAELIEATGQPRAIVRHALQRLVFEERVVTCDTEATRNSHGQFDFTTPRFRFGDPTKTVINVGIE